MPCLAAPARSTEAPEDASERAWAEEQLRAERRKNIRLGIAEPLDVTMARVQALHHQTRVQPIVKSHQVRGAQGLLCLLTELCMAWHVP
jgi:hypothetical protein